MTTTRTIYQPSGFGPLTIILSLLALLGLADVVAGLLELAWTSVTADLILFAVFAAGAVWMYRRRRRAAVLLAPRHLISRDGVNDDIEIPIEDAVADIVEVVAGTALAPMTRTLQLPDADGVPTQKVIVISYNGESTELYQIRGVRPPTMRKIRDDINAALTAARKEYNYPEPARLEQ